MATQEHAEKGERIHRAPLVKNVLPTSGIVISGGKAYLQRAFCPQGGQGGPPGFNERRSRTKVLSRTEKVVRNICQTEEYIPHWWSITS